MRGSGSRGGSKQVIALLSDDGGKGCGVHPIERVKSGGRVNDAGVERTGEDHSHALLSKLQSAREGVGGCRTGEGECAQHSRGVGVDEAEHDRSPVRWCTEWPGVFLAVARLSVWRVVLVRYSGAAGPRSCRE